MVSTPPLTKASNDRPINTTATIPSTPMSTRNLTNTFMGVLLFRLMIQPAFVNVAKIFSAVFLSKSPP